MNLTESMKHIFNKKDHSILKQFFTKDLKKILQEIESDPRAFQLMKDIKTSAFDIFEIIKVVPERVKTAFKFLKQDLSHQLDTLPDPKHKTLFGLKVIGALSSFSVGTFVTAKNSNMIRLPGLKKQNLATQLLIAHLILKVSHALVLHLIDELEEHLTDEEELKSLRYFKIILTNPAEWEKFQDSDQVNENDEAFKIVNSFKNYLMTGHRH